MYHFIYTVSKKVFPNAFDITKNVDPEKEQIINFCPKCNEELEDRKIITLRIHDKLKHPKTEKEMVKRFYTRGGTPMFVVMCVIIILTIGVVVSTNISSQMWIDSLTAEEKEYRDFCNALIENQPKAIWFWMDQTPYYEEKSEYVLENLDSFKKCYYGVTYSSLGDRDERLEYFHSLDEEK